MGTELFMRMLSVMLSRVGFAFFVGGLFFSLIMHNSDTYALLVQSMNDFFVQLFYALLGVEK